MSESALRALPNVGPKVARMLVRIGIERPEQLLGENPVRLYASLCDVEGQRLDPCLLDTLTAIVDYADGAPARPWWYYSRIRKAAATR